MGVEAIGGLFFRSNDPDLLAQWYRDHLGIGAGCDATGSGQPDEWAWKTVGGPVVFAPFKQTTDYFAADKQWMLNLRVTSLDELLESLKRAGIEVITKAEWDAPETGRFARVHDPEGNAIELWSRQLLPDRLTVHRLLCQSGRDWSLWRSVVNPARV